uniref:EF-hand domain-containing protein n=1 Tax=Ficedula albicollis TaxID=59894 RepID=A0A803VML5_FICAL
MGTGRTEGQRGQGTAGQGDNPEGMGDRGHGDRGTTGTGRTGGQSREMGDRGTILQGWGTGGTQEGSPLNRAGYMEKLFQETDLNKDKELSFEEFTVVLSKLADDAHRISHGSERCGPDRD